MVMVEIAAAAAVAPSVSDNVPYPNPVSLDKEDVQYGHPIICAGFTTVPINTYLAIQEILV